MGEPSSYRLILASGSPARRDLLRKAGFDFEVIPSNVPEPTEGFSDPRPLVATLAWNKAAAVAAHVAGSESSNGKPIIILAADTVGWLNGQVLGKPDDAADARRILQLLSGTEHELWTGVCLWLLPGNLQIAWQEVSQVAMAALSEADLQAYLATGGWQGNSGAYAIQEEGDDPLVRVRAGSKSNVIGLPMESLARVFAWLLAHPPAFPRSPLRPDSHA